MRSHTLAAAGVLALVVLVAASNTTRADPLLRAERAASQDRQLLEAAFPRHIRGTLDANLAITAYPTVCVVSGRVKGDVTVRSTDRRCATGSRFVALSVEGGTIDGRIVTAGKRCVMAWFHDGALVNGDIVFGARGNLGFLGNRDGAKVRGDVLVKGGHLWATGRSRTNRIDGNLTCSGGAPAGRSKLATRTNWDGAGRDADDERVDVDGTIGGRYVGCQRAR